MGKRPRGGRCSLPYLKTRAVLGVRLLEDNTHLSALQPVLNRRGRGSTSRPPTPLARESTPGRMCAGAALPRAESGANWNLGSQLSNSVGDVFSAGIAHPLDPHLSATCPQLCRAGPQPLRSDPLPFLGEPDWLQVRRRVSGLSALQ